MAIPFLTLLPVVEKVFERIFPDPAQAADAKLKLIELEQSGELAKLTAETDMAKGQMEINKIEAGSTDKFAARWRPFIGWVCGFAFAYTLIIQPFMIFVATFYGYPVGANLPPIDGDLLGWALGGMLGLGAMRTTEKVKGVL